MSIKENQQKDAPLFRCPRDEEMTTRMPCILLLKECFVPKYGERLAVVRYPRLKQALNPVAPRLKANLAD